MRLTALAEGVAFGALALAMLGCETILWFRGPAVLASMIGPLGVRVPELSVQLSHAINAHLAIAIMLPVVGFASCAYLIFARLDIDKLFTAVVIAVSCAILATHLFIVPAIARTLTLKYFTQDSMKIVGDHTVVNLGSMNFDVTFYSGRNILMGSLGQVHQADYFICWQRYYGLLPEVSRRQFAIVKVSGPTSLDGSGAMLLLKRSDLPDDISFRN
jgi:hypothetical protein